MHSGAHRCAVAANAPAGAAEDTTGILPNARVPALGRLYSLALCDLFIARTTLGFARPRPAPVAPPEAPAPVPVGTPWLACAPRVSPRTRALGGLRRAFPPRRSCRDGSALVSLDAALATDRPLRGRRRRVRDERADRDRALTRGRWRPSVVTARATDAAPGTVTLGPWPPSARAPAGTARAPPALPGPGPVCPEPVVERGGVTLPDTRRRISSVCTGSVCIAPRRVAPQNGKSAHSERAEGGAAPRVYVTDIATNLC